MKIVLVQAGLEIEHPDHPHPAPAECLLTDHCNKKTRNGLSPIYERPDDYVPCASISHLLTLDDQLQLWRVSYENLHSGGRFVVGKQMPNLAVRAESQTRPARSLTGMDRHITDADQDSRLLRHKTTSYESNEQKALIRFLYERFERDVSVDRYFDDSANYIYFPRELQLLFVHTGFEIESIIGNYRGRPLGPSSRRMVMTGRRKS